jgi:predicted nucleotidyltransferase
MTNINENLSSKYDIIFKTVAGSYLYGTATENSDLDERGVCMEPVDSLLGLANFEQYEYRGDSRDIVLYGLRKFVNLALGQNPNITEILFAPTREYKLFNGKTTPIGVSQAWMDIVNIRHAFLSRKVCDTFIGYAVSQLKRMETHYRWMGQTPPVKPSPFDYGYIMATNSSASTWTSVNEKNRYDNDLKTWTQYNTWLENRNKDRHGLEEKYGYDTKNAMHLVRLLQQGEELLETGNLTLPRPNAKQLLEVRNGIWTYDTVLKYMETKKVELESIKETSVLPKNPDYKTVADMVTKLNYNYVNMIFDEKAYK